MAGSDNYYVNIWPMTDTADLFVRIGWAPDVVRLTSLTEGKRFIWNRIAHGATGGAAASGGISIGVTGGAALVGASTGIVLCKFTTDPINTTSDPEIVDATNWIDANGIKLSSTVDMLKSDHLIMIEAWRMQYIWLKGVHDGTTSSNTYFEDSSYDFKELGVSGNGQWLIYNQTNGNYAYVKSVTKPAGKTKHCRIYTATDADGTATTAADFDTSDVCWVFPIQAMCYPLGDIGIMT